MIPSVRVTISLCISSHIDINQSDLLEVGSQGVVSEILAGKREFNIRKVRTLSECLGVCNASFCEERQMCRIEWGVDAMHSFLSELFCRSMIAVLS